MKKVFDWIDRVQQDSNGSSRILFLDTVAGTGSPLPNISAKLKEDRSLFVLPTMDFDQLPLDMPVLALLVQALSPLITQVDDEYLTLHELHCDVFDGIVAGLSPVNNDGDGLDQTLAYSEKTSGWYRTPERLEELLSKTRARMKLQRIHHIVVSIDNIHAPMELAKDIVNSLRLLVQPRIMFLVTGDFESFKFNLELGYLGRFKNHDGLGSHHRENIHRNAKNISTAMLEELIPSSAKIKD